MFFNAYSAAWFWSLYLADPADGDSPYASPLKAADHSRLPATLIITSEFCPVRNEGEAYANALSLAGVSVDCHRYEGLPHGFLALMSVLDVTRDALDEIVDFLGQRLGCDSHVSHHEISSETVSPHRRTNGTRRARQGPFNAGQCFDRRGEPVSDFSELVAIVTGGTGAIGLAAAELLTSRGAQVAVLARHPDGLPEGILGIKADVTDDASVRSAVDSVVGRFGQLDVVVNNVGIPTSGDVAANSDDEWARVLDVNVVGMVRVARHALPHLRRSSAAAVVNVGSVVGWAGMQQRALYSATKGAVHALTLAMAADYVREGIRVNCVAPGATDTPWVDKQLEKAETLRPPGSSTSHSSRRQGGCCPPQRWPARSPTWRARCRAIRRAHCLPSTALATACACARQRAPKRPPPVGNRPQLSARDRR